MREKLTEIEKKYARFFVWDAVVAWRDSIYKAPLMNSSKSAYLSNMLKLIETDIIKVETPLDKITDDWFEDSKCKIGTCIQWAPKTKILRKTSLYSLFNFIKTTFDTSGTPYRSHPEPSAIKHVLSVVKEKALTTVISPSKLCHEICKTNERDAYIVWLMMHTGQTLETILDIRKEDLRGPYLDFPNITSKWKEGVFIPKHAREALENFCQSSLVYLFETSNNKRIRRTQVMRNMKQAGYSLGLTFDLTPKVLHGYVIAYMSKDKRSELEKEIFPMISLINSEKGS